jgi:uncharacterized protein
MLLPKTLDPIKLAKQQSRLSGELPLSMCNRLQDIDDQANHVAQVDLQFGQDDSRLYFIKGELKATVNLQCQRCNAPMQYTIDTSFALSPVTSEERAKTLSERYDPVFMNDEVIDIHAMIEDEILLALPMVPKHEQCDL